MVGQTLLLHSKALGSLLSPAIADKKYQNSRAQRGLSALDRVYCDFLFLRPQLQHALVGQGREFYPYHYSLLPLLLHVCSSDMDEAR